MITHFSLEAQGGQVGGAKHWMQSNRIPQKKKEKDKNETQLSMT
jgi:hypothetical protein